MKRWTSDKDTELVADMFKGEMTARIIARKLGKSTYSKRTFRDFDDFQKWVEAQDIKNGAEYDLPSRKVRIVGQMWSSKDGQQSGQDYITVKFQRRNA